MNQLSTHKLKFSKTWLTLLLLQCLTLSNLWTQPLFDYSSIKDSTFSFTKQLDLVYAVGAINLGEGTKELHMDVFAPQEMGEVKKIALLYIHGGGFFAGNKSNMRLPGEYF